eukprot:4278038-Pyramimonas_sp.AAC.1
MFASLADFFQLSLLLGFVPGRPCPAAPVDQVERGLRGPWLDDFIALVWQRAGCHMHCCLPLAPHISQIRRFRRRRRHDLRVTP